MSARRMKVYKQEFKEIFGKEPDDQEFQMWKKIRKKSGYANLTKTQIENYQIMWRLAARRELAQQTPSVDPMALLRKQK